MTTKFPLGLLTATPGVLAAFKKANDAPLRYVIRHLICDWGDVGAEDKRTNDDALIHGNRLLSSYQLKDDTKIWIITEADRASTTILLPEEC